MLATQERVLEERYVWVNGFLYARNKTAGRNPFSVSFGWFLFWLFVLFFLVPFWFVLSLLGLPTGLCIGPLPALLRLLTQLTALQAITIQLVCCGWTCVMTWRKPWRRWTEKKRHAKTFLCESLVRGCTVYWTTLNLLELNIFKPILEQCKCRWTVRKPF